MFLFVIIQGRHCEGGGTKKEKRPKKSELFCPDGLEMAVSSPIHRDSFSSSSHAQQQQQQQQQEPVVAVAAAATTTTTTEPIDASVHPTLLQPRVAVVLNVPQPWHPWLFVLRLLSILPALWWGLPSALQLLLRILPGPELVVVVGRTGLSGIEDMGEAVTARYTLTEMGLATIWVCVCLR